MESRPSVSLSLDSQSRNFETEQQMRPLLRQVKDEETISTLEVINSYLKTTRVESYIQAHLKRVLAQDMVPYNPFPLLVKQMEQLSLQHTLSGKHIADDIERMQQSKKVVVKDKALGIHHCHGHGISIYGLLPVIRMVDTRVLFQTKSWANQLVRIFQDEFKHVPECTILRSVEARSLFGRLSTQSLRMKVGLDLIVRKTSEDRESHDVLVNPLLSCISRLMSTKSSSDNMRATLHAVSLGEDKWTLSSISTTRTSPFATALEQCLKVSKPMHIKVYLKVDDILKVVTFQLEFHTVANALAQTATTSSTTIPFWSLMTSVFFEFEQAVTYAKLFVNSERPTPTDPKVLKTTFGALSQQLDHGIATSDLACQDVGVTVSQVLLLSAMKAIEFNSVDKLDETLRLAYAIQHSLLARVDTLQQVLSVLEGLAEDIFPAGSSSPLFPTLLDILELFGVMLDDVMADESYAKLEYTEPLARLLHSQLAVSLRQLSHDSFHSLSQLRALLDSLFYSLREDFYPVLSRGVFSRYLTVEAEEPPKETPQAKDMVALLEWTSSTTAWGLNDSLFVLVSELAKQSRLRHELSGSAIRMQYVVDVGLDVAIDSSLRKVISKECLPANPFGVVSREYMTHMWEVEVLWESLDTTRLRLDRIEPAPVETAPLEAWLSQLQRPKVDPPLPFVLSGSKLFGTFEALRLLHPQRLDAIFQLASRLDLTPFEKYHPILCLAGVTPTEASFNPFISKVYAPLVLAASSASRAAFLGDLVTSVMTALKHPLNHVNSGAASPMVLVGITANGQYWSWEDAELNPGELKSALMSDFSSRKLPVLHGYVWVRPLFTAFDIPLFIFCIHQSGRALVHPNRSALIELRTTAVFHSQTECETTHFLVSLCLLSLKEATKSQDLQVIDRQVLDDVARLDYYSAYRRLCYRGRFVGDFELFPSLYKLIAAVPATLWFLKNTYSTLRRLLGMLAVLLDEQGESQPRGGGMELDAEAQAQRIKLMHNRIQAMLITATSLTRRALTMHALLVPKSLYRLLLAPILAELSHPTLMDLSFISGELSVLSLHVSLIATHSGAQIHGCNPQVQSHLRIINALAEERRKQEHEDLSTSVDATLVPAANDVGKDAEEMEVPVLQALGEEPIASMNNAAHFSL
eukprot:m.193788 g.193788  ORF g.193788 m.193788 type:complete len:1146 (-) comp14885_c2_seq1:152-3589(-)